MFSRKSFNKRQFVSSALAIAASVAAVAGFVYGATTIGTNISVDGNLTVSGTSATSTFSTGGLAVGTNQFVVQQTSGNIGIGTISPTHPLSLGGTNPSFILRDNSTTSSSVLVQSFSDGTNRLVFFGLGGVVRYDFGLEPEFGSVNNFALRNETLGLTIFTVSGATGNIGIGTTSPVQLLSVVGDAYIAGTGTTTLNLKTTTASKGTCIEMFDSGGAVRRLYINAAGAITVEAGTCK